MSHYSEIVVSSAGYDVWQQPPGTDVPHTKMLQHPHQPQQLSSRRELVELLDSEPLFDYLVRNGVLEKERAEAIQCESSPVKINLALLQHVEESGNTAHNLLVNALRQSGQHYLANMLDEGTRIKALTGSGRG